MKLKHGAITEWKRCYWTDLRRGQLVRAHVVNAGVVVIGTVVRIEKYVSFTHDRIRVTIKPADELVPHYGKYFIAYDWDCIFMIRSGDQYDSDAIIEKHKCNCSREQVLHYGCVCGGV